MTLDEVMVKVRRILRPHETTWSFPPSCFFLYPPDRCCRGDLAIYEVQDKEITIAIMATTHNAPSQPKDSANRDDLSGTTGGQVEQVENTTAGSPRDGKTDPDDDTMVELRDTYVKPGMDHVKV